MVDVTPGDSGANKGYWRFQLRDRYGQFVEMGGDVIFEVNLPGVKGTARAVGKFIGMYDLKKARIEVSDDREVPKGVYIVESSKITAAEASLPSDYVEKKIAEAKTPDALPLKNTISGDEALKTRLKSVAKILKEEGRFPVPRIGIINELGKDTDTAKGAKADYKKVFDLSPELQERFKDFDSMWDYVYNSSTDATSQSPNDLNDIEPEIKMLNRAYAQHILGMEPDGLITVYRNAVNGKTTESESAVGYVSLNRDFAFDYASHRDNVGANGRYEIDVKPDEVQGMLGYSKIEDEYALVIGRGVTEQEGRVRRVGDVAIVDLEAPWLKEWNRETFNRGLGGTPQRHFGTAGSFDFHEVEPLGDTLTDFLEKHNLEASAISAKFDELHGEGAYQDYKGSGNTLSFLQIKSLFIDLGNGKVGLDASKFINSEGVKPNSEYKNDYLDNVLKMLSTLQELSGEPFMTHKSRDYTPPKQPNNQTGIFKDYSPDNSSSAAEDTPLTDLGVDPEEEITVYRGVPGDAQDGINSGDWVTTLPQLAKDYAGFGGKVVSMKVKAKDLLVSVNEGDELEDTMQEMVYRPE